MHNYINGFFSLLRRIEPPEFYFLVKGSGISSLSWGASSEMWVVTTKRIKNIALLLIEDASHREGEMLGLFWVNSKHNTMNHGSLLKTKLQSSLISLSTSAATHKIVINENESKFHVTQAVCQFHHRRTQLSKLLSISFSKYTNGNEILLLYNFFLIIRFHYLKNI